MNTFIIAIRQSGQTRTLTQTENETNYRPTTDNNDTQIVSLGVYRSEYETTVQYS